MEPRKRPLDLVAAADLLRREAPDVAYVIVGEGPELDETKEACRRLGLMHQFRFVRWIPYERMPAYFNLADAVVQPSEWEGLARVYLETMASGRVLIASDIPPAREVVRHDENGLLFETANVDALARTIQRAAGDPALRDRIGREARASVSSYALERKADEYMQVFHDVLRQT
jgi:glycosyltransferase involved in cell wall biosynthesis